jgi:uncharacterized coiled-coil protein SlyX
MSNLTSRVARRRFLLAGAIACLVLSPQTEAVTPAPTGGYLNDNTAVGENALFSLTTGIDNVAAGYEALFSDTTGSFNTCLGYHALYSNTTGTRNTATGNTAMSHNTTGGNNTAVGLHALILNTSGRYNTGTGAFALCQNSIGSNNIALGYNAGIKLTTGSDNIDIGNVGLAGETGALRIGTPGKQTATYLAGVYKATVPNGLSVIIDPDGHLGTVTSSARFKEQVQPIAKASEAILALEPATFRYKAGIDPAGVPQFGLIAEQVEKVNPALVARDPEGRAYSVRYEAINAMLLNEFLKEHRKVEEQQIAIQELKATAAKQEARATQLQKQVEVLTATIQKVSERLNVSNPATQLVTN